MNEKKKMVIGSGERISVHTVPVKKKICRKELKVSCWSRNCF